MPRNLHGGSKAKKGSNKTNYAISSGRTEFVEKSKDGTTVYAKIVRKLGCGFVDVITEEKKQMRCSIRGKFMKKSKSWVQDDIVIVDKMTCATNDSKGMIITHLSKEQVRMLEKRGDITKSTFNQPNSRRSQLLKDDSDCEFEFDDKDDDFQFDEGNDEDDDLLQPNMNRPTLYNKKSNKNNDDSEEESDSDVDLDEL